MGTIRMPSKIKENNQDYNGTILRNLTNKNHVTIRNQDCIQFLQSLPNESIDIITTDPAYSGMNQKMKFGNGRIVGKYENGNHSKWFKEFHDDPANYRTFLFECQRVLKKDSHIYIMFDSFSMLSLGAIIREFFSVKNIITWDKISMGMGHNFRRRHEFVIFATKGYKKLNSKNIPDVWRFKRVHSKFYPTQKPVEVFEAMLAASSERGHVVCDPFLGSGSAAIAALKKGCRFVGADISSAACKLSISRITNFLKLGVDILQKTSASSSDEKNMFWK